jgi:hypothetical protein
LRAKPSNPELSDAAIDHRGAIAASRWRMLGLQRSSSRKGEKRAIQDRNRHFVTIQDHAPGVYGMTGAERTTQTELADFTWDGGG